MLPSPLTIAPVGAVSAASPAAAIGDGRQAAFQRALQSLVGQSVTGEVLSRFNDGSFMVNVAEHAVRMQLPADAGVGSRLPLTVLSAEPRATFELAQPSSSVVLYGEAHVPAGTGDLYRPQSGSAAPASSPSSTTPATPAGSMAGSAGASSAAVGSISAQAAAASLAGDAAESAASARPPTPPFAAAQPPSTAAQLASMAAAYPALAAGAAATATATAAGRSPTAASPSLSASDDAVDGANHAGSAHPAGASSTAASANASTGGAASASQSSRTHSAAASLLGKAPLTPAAQLPGLDAGTSQPELSTAARILGSLLSQPAAASALPLLGKAALFSQGAPEPAQLAQTLQNTIEESGLFYESHVAAWSRGERTLEQLQREPQMQQARLPSTASSDATAVPDRNAAQQINQQLLTHEQGRVQWQGEAWPGQPMQWEIRRQNEREARGRSSGGAADATPVWRSNLRLRFAELGELNASITLVGQQIHLQLQTDDAASGATLRAQAGVLEQAMAAAGIPLSSCQINDGDSHDG